MLGREREMVDGEGMAMIRDGKRVNEPRIFFFFWEGVEEG